MKEIAYYEMVKKIIGKIEPIGESNEDSKRLENIKDLIELAECIIADIDNISIRYKDCQECSINKIWKEANIFIHSLETYKVQD